MNRLAAALLTASTLALVGLWAGPMAPVSAASSDAKVNLHLYADGWSPYYRWPFGAAATGSQDLFRLRSSRAVTKATFYLVDEATGAAQPYSMSLQWRGRQNNFWQVSVKMPKKPGQLGYHFSAQAGNAKRWYGDNDNVGESGPGQTYTDVSQVLDYELTVFQSGFSTPGWVHKAVMYEIFPDRFFDGDTANDALEATGTQYGYITTIFHKNWDSLPVENSPCSDPSGIGNNNCDFFGGDLQGVIDKLGYLHGLGITAIYLTPIFLAPSNHKYDTSDFMEIDPEFGTLQTFHTLTADAKQLGIHIILDGAFEDTGSDSLYFDKYGNFKAEYGPGAADSQSSPYYSWYTFFTWPTLYQSWEGIATLPALNDDSKAVENYIYGGPNSVARYWLKQGASGWRLDSADQLSDPFWQAFRTSVKSAYPNAAIIGEDFSGDPTPELLGNEWDGSMNYRFRDALLDFFANGQGAQNRNPLGAAEFLETEMGLLSEVPWQADMASMNIVDSQDTIRILSALQGNKQKLRLVALYQMTWPGIPTIYYGDEAGQVGLNDPDNRRTFPWDHQDTSLEGYYAKIIHLREGLDALSEGSVTPLFMSDRLRTLAYLRHYGNQSVVVALNDSAKAETISFPVGLKNGTVLKDQLSSASTTVTGGLLNVTVPALSGRILATGTS